jgi:hypothetical protein
MQKKFGLLGWNRLVQRHCKEITKKLWTKFALILDSPSRQLTREETRSARKLDLDTYFTSW